MSRMRGQHAFRLGIPIEILLILCCTYTSIQAQSTAGFLSIDCGGTPHTDPVTEILWVGDSQYTFTGMDGTVPFQVNSTLDNAGALQTFRYFPERMSKHCYDLPTTQGNISVLIRAMFLHGSSSELILPITFDVAVNGTTWFTLQYALDDTYNALATPIIAEGIFYSPGNLTHFCLIPSQGNPFISSLEMRQLDPDGNMYFFTDSQTQYLSNLRRFNCGAPPSSPTVRYPDDKFDRLWYTPGSWAKNFVSRSTTLQTTVITSPVNQVPPAVMQDAWVNDTAVDGILGFNFYNFGTDPTELSYGVTVDTVYIAIYCQELESNAAVDARVFEISINGDKTAVLTAQTYTQMHYYWNWFILLEETHFLFAALPNATLGPIVNAVEVYAQFSFNDSTTEAQNVDVLAALQASFNLTDWQGDPCYPVAWDWVRCTLDNPAKVDALFLSNYGINAAIPSFISYLDSLTEIQLYNNSLYGSIPESLATLPNLTVLSLEDNNLSGQVPPALLSKSGLQFQYSGNSLLGIIPPVQSPSSPPGSSPGSSTKKSSNIAGILGGIAGGIAALAVVTFLVIWCCCCKKPKPKINDNVPSAIPSNQTSAIPLPLRKPTSMATSVDSAEDPPSLGNQAAGVVPYEAVKLATDNFKNKIGEGSYGAVFHGWLTNRQVAVKLNNVQSNQGEHEFITEVDILTRVHHRNLVSLIAYCNEGQERILIYEFEVNGTLRDWLHDDGYSRGILDWRKRLQIAADAAKGLEYLHKGCEPTIIHRDVKSNNILLDESMTAKVADFGLSKSAPGQHTSGYSTTVKGTPGYLDPEYHRLGKLTFKSDVYSFGVVLAELMTGRQPFNQTTGVVLVEWVRHLVQRNDIESLVDPRLQGSYNPESMWKMAEITLSCTVDEGAKRPDFTQVVNAISDAMEIENLNSFTTHSPILAPSRSFILGSSANHGYQNLH